MPSSSRRLVLPLIFVAYLVFAFFLTGSPCVFRVVTGVPCPGCGLTRAGIAFLHLDFRLAFFYHPMVFLILPGIFYILIQSLIRKKPIGRSIPLFIVLGVCLYIVYIIRMVFLFPDLEPMVYDSSSILGRLLFP